MGTCAMCGNNYEKTFTVIDPEGVHHTFDAFECAIHALAPRCASCGCMVIGHGVQNDESIYCCAFCARKEGVDGLVDRT